MLLAHPGWWPDAIDELLRFVSPTTVTGATATEDAVVDGTLVPAGTPTSGPGRRQSNPAVFHDPDRFDVTRSPNPHLAFAAGAHYCLGAPLARMHAEIALPALFTRLPGPPARGRTPVGRQRAGPASRIPASHVELSPWI